MYVKLNGEMVYLWRAVDHEGQVMESYLTRTCDKVAALAFTKKTPKGSIQFTYPDGVPRIRRRSMSWSSRKKAARVMTWLNTARIAKLCWHRANGGC